MVFCEVTNKNYCSHRIGKGDFVLSVPFMKQASVRGSLRPGEILVVLQLAAARSTAHQRQNPRRKLEPQRVTQQSDVVNGPLPLSIAAERRQSRKLHDKNDAAAWFPPVNVIELSLCIIISIHLWVQSRPPPRVNVGPTCVNYRPIIIMRYWTRILE